MQVSSLADAQLLELQNWVNETYHKKYVYEGVAVGADHPSAFSERRIGWRAVAGRRPRERRVDRVEVE